MRWPGGPLLGGLPVRRLLLLALLPLQACIPPYEPPRADQPHAVIKLRRSYEQVAGARLAESVQIDEHAALREGVISAVAAEPRTDALLAHPIPSTFEVSSNFFHVESRMVTESYQVPQHHYRTESYSCGFGQSTHMCTRSVSTTTYETRYRTVLRQVEVSDGHCGRALRFFPQNQHVYLLQYTYHAHGACSLSCFEQVAGPEGTFQNRACPAAPPEKD
jgi:hypothetical protein